MKQKVVKQYLASLIDVRTYSRWINGSKVIISAPTGAGKTTFILKKLLPYCKEHGKKMLILCNRRLLDEQYGFDLADIYERFIDMEDSVTVKTYQKLSEELKMGVPPQKMFNNFDVVVLDEVHFFYADSDFNPYGTYVLLQAIVQAGFFKSMIMITATLTEVLPLIEKTFFQCARKLKSQNPEEDISSYEYHGEVFDFSYLQNYERFQGYFVEDEETLCNEIARDTKKTIIFIDDKQKAEKFRKMLVATKKVRLEDIFLLNAQILEEKPNDLSIRTLAVGHKLDKKILLTTSVLDNGVSVHDSDIGNIVLATESKVSFIQMLGRIRAESVDNCKLYIYPRTVSFYEKRVQQYSEKMQWFDKLSRISMISSFSKLLTYGWYGKDEKAEFIRNTVVITQNETEFYQKEFRFATLIQGNPILAINQFAKEKTGNLLNAYKKFLKLSLTNPKMVAIEQIRWIGKGADELIEIKSSYMEERKKAMRTELLKIKGYNLAELGEAKKELSEKFCNDALRDYISKKGSFSTELLAQICESVDLEIRIENGTDRKKIYTVVEKVDDTGK